MTNTPLSSLQECRQKIDQIDEAIVDLLRKRFDVVEQVVKIKERENVPVRIPERIEAVINNAVAWGTARHLDPHLLKTIWQNIVETSCQLEEKALGEKSDL